MSVRINQCSNWYRIMDQCKYCQSNCNLPIINNIHEQRKISAFMNRTSIRIAWLGLKRVWMGEFLWLDCLKPRGTFTLETWKSYENCGYMNVRDRLIYAGRCNIRNKGILCQKKNCSSCSEVRTTHKCKEIGSSCYIAVYRGSNWMEGRAFCYGKGWRMAVLTEENDDDLTKKIADKLPREKLHIDTRKFLWIGLRREEWVYVNGNQVGSGDVNTTFWERNEPADIGNCSVIVRTSAGVYKWRASSCTAKYIVLCYNKEKAPKQREDITTAGATTGMPLTEVTKIKSVSGMNIANLTLTVLLFPTAIVVCCYAKHWMKKHQQKIRRNPTEPTNSGRPSERKILRTT